MKEKQTGENPIIETVEFDFSEYKAEGKKIRFKLKSSLKLIPSPKGNNQKEGGEMRLGYHLHEHIRLQQKNVNLLIKHEEDVLIALKALKLFKPRKSIKDEAIEIIHARLLEGFECWREKIGKYDKDKKKARTK